MLGDKIERVHLERMLVQWLGMSAFSLPPKRQSPAAGERASRTVCADAAAIAASPHPKSTTTDDSGCSFSQLIIFSTGLTGHFFT